jgi:hypothetical protein
MYVKALGGCVVPGGLPSESGLLTGATDRSSGGDSGTNTDNMYLYRCFNGDSYVDECVLSKLS